MERDLESKLREEQFNNLSFPIVQNIFDNYELSVDVMREIQSQMKKKHIQMLQDEMVTAAILVTVHGLNYWTNCIKYIKAGLVMFEKQKLVFDECIHAIDKFQYRFNWQSSPQYQEMKNRRQIACFTDSCGRVMEMVTY